MKNPISLAIVDDEALFRRGMALLIQQFTHIQLRWESDTAQGLMDQLATESSLPDVLLIDIKTQSWDGVEQARLFAKKYPSVRMVMLSSYFSPSFVIHMLELGASAYLSKQSSPRQVEQTIQGVMQKGYFYSEVVMAIVRKNLTSKKGPPLPNLGIEISGRSQEVLQLICEQYTNAEISAKLAISTRTVEWHRLQLCKKLNCKNTAGLVALAVQQNLVQVDSSVFWQKRNW
jgi:DNA-binding NarL/FixJ family response regulator